MSDRLIWSDSKEIDAVSYVCAYCDKDVAPDEGWEAYRKSDLRRADPLPAVAVPICHNCRLPSTIVRPHDRFGRRQFPSPAAGRSVEHLPTPVDEIYEEARRALAASAPTAAALVLRTLISYIASEEDADQGQTFAAYVDWLSDQQLVPRGADEWLERIKDVGNEAAHELEPIDRAQVELLLDFAELVLRNVYEAPEKWRLNYETSTEGG